MEKSRVQISKRYNPMMLNLSVNTSELMRRDLSEMMNKLLPVAQEAGFDATNCDLEVGLAYVRRVRPKARKVKK